MKEAKIELLKEDAAFPFPSENGEVQISFVPLPLHLHHYKVDGRGATEYFRSQKIIMAGTDYEKICLFIEENRPKIIEFCDEMGLKRITFLPDKIDDSGKPIFSPSFRKDFRGEWDLIKESPLSPTINGRVEYFAIISTEEANKQWLQ